jgi:hypothetical protein
LSCTAAENTPPLRHVSHALATSLLAFRIASQEADEGHYADIIDITMPIYLRRQLAAAFIEIRLPPPLRHCFRH